MIEDTSHGVCGYFFWNMVLNETGRSTWEWRQNSLLTVNRRSQKLVYNPEYFSMKHFSAMVRPGARRIECKGGALKGSVAFLNPDGEKVVLFANETDQIVPVDIRIGEELHVQLQVPAKSMNTVTVKD